jgi:pimeloyl-ACP methyl ester carboxylesterase
MGPRVTMPHANSMSDLGKGRTRRAFRMFSHLLAVVSMFGARGLCHAQTAGVPVERPTRGFMSVTVGPGRVFRYRCAGRGRPTVVVEQGMGISVETVFSWEKRVGWAVIFPQVAKVTQVCVYDRAGLGRSTPLNSPATSLDAAHDLHGLLQTLRIAPPYVLAGQSLGGLDALMYAHTYPQAVAGLVLIDSAHPDQAQRFGKVLPPRSPDESAVLRGFRDGPDQPVAGEWFDFPRNSKLMRDLPPVGNKPLIVLTHDPRAVTPGGLVPAEWEHVTEPVWQQLQVELSELSTHSQHTVVDHAGHNIQLEHPEVVTDAIFEVVAQVRVGSP